MIWIIFVVWSILLGNLSYRLVTSHCELPRFRINFPGADFWVTNTKKQKKWNDLIKLKLCFYSDETRERNETLVLCPNTNPNWCYGEIYHRDCFEWFFLNESTLLTQSHVSTWSKRERKWSNSIQFLPILWCQTKTKWNFRFFPK